MHSVEYKKRSIKYNVLYCYVMFMSTTKSLTVISSIHPMWSSVLRGDKGQIMPVAVLLWVCETKPYCFNRF